VNHGASVALSPTQRPPTTAASTRANPQMVLRSTVPGRMKRIGHPMEQRDRDGGPDGEVSPRGCPERIDDDHAEDGHQDHHDQQHTAQRREATEHADFLARHLPSDLPSRRTDPARMRKSCTAPPSTTPTMIQSVRARSRTAHTRLGR